MKSIHPLVYKLVADASSHVHSLHLNKTWFFDNELLPLFKAIHIRDGWTTQHALGFVGEKHLQRIICSEVSDLVIRLIKECAPQLTHLVIKYARHLSVIDQKGTLQPLLSLQETKLEQLRLSSNYDLLLVSTLIHKSPKLYELGCVFNGHIDLGIMTAHAGVRKLHLTSAIPHYKCRISLLADKYPNLTSLDLCVRHEYLEDLLHLTRWKLQKLKICTLSSDDLETISVMPAVTKVEFRFEPLKVSISTLCYTFPNVKYLDLVLHVENIHTIVEIVTRMPHLREFTTQLAEGGHIRSLYESNIVLDKLFDSQLRTIYIIPCDYLYSLPKGTVNIVWLLFFAVPCLCKATLVEHSSFLAYEASTTITKNHRWVRMFAKLELAEKKSALSKMYCISDWEQYMNNTYLL